MTKNNNDNANALHGTVCVCRIINITVSILHAALEMRKHAYMRLNENKMRSQKWQSFR